MHAGTAAPAAAQLSSIMTWRPGSAKFGGGRLGGGVVTRLPVEFSPCARKAMNRPSAEIVGIWLSSSTPLALVPLPGTMLTIDRAHKETPPVQSARNTAPRMPGASNGLAMRLLAVL